MTGKYSGNPFIILFISLIILTTLSLVDWANITIIPNKENCLLKSFNLLGDLIPEDSTTAENTDFIDPALSEAMSFNSDTIIQSNTYNKDSSDMGFVDTAIIGVKPTKINGEVQIEDYSISQNGLINFKNAIKQKDNRIVRIAVIGDSYIEGDIFTQHIRELLQNKYGGKGVGYVAMDCITKRFRKSVNHTSAGWNTYSLNKKGGEKHFALSGVYCATSGNASASYTGTSFVDNVASWENSKFIFISPENTSIEVNVGNGWISHNIEAGNDVKCITIDNLSNTFQLKTKSKSLIGLGVWLNDNNGIAVDCMSLRGNSGITHLKINPSLARQMAKYVDYDLIILEYGLNVLSGSNTKYNFYADYMVKVVNHLRECYPYADFLILGSGDRGIKQGPEIHSMKTIPYLIAAQREVARRSQCLFWDTREAMGGEDAVVSWCSTGDINKDYIHLSTSGGERLANIFVNSLLKAVNE